MSFLSIIFWIFLATYIIHVLDETLMNGGFVKWISENFWPAYHVRMFFWFNAAFIVAIVASNSLFDTFGGHWVILPIIFKAIPENRRILSIKENKTPSWRVS